MALGAMTTLLLAAGLMAQAEAKSAVKSPLANSSSFVQPSAPSPTARPNSKLPNLGRDKHGMPFYHPKQLNRVVRTTAYTHSEKDHIGYGAKNAIGTSLKYGQQVRSAAADWSVYPLGTKFKIKGQPYTYVVDDYGSALVGTGTIDIYQPSRPLMNKWGRRIVEIQIIQWGSSQLSMQKLADRRKYAHCARMYASLERQSSHRKTAKR